MPTTYRRVHGLMVGTRSLSSGAHSRDPVALPTLRTVIARPCAHLRIRTGRSSTPCSRCEETGAAEYWMPRLKRGMTVVGNCEISSA